MVSTMDQLIVTLGELGADQIRRAGFEAVIAASSPASILDPDGSLRPHVAVYAEFVIVIPHGGEDVRDTIAVNLGDTRCRWAYFPETEDKTDLRNAIIAARPMWTDEVAAIDDIPDAEPEQTFETGFRALDDHGFRLVTPAFMPVIGPYGSGKSVFLRQLLVNLWRLHGWRSIITSFEERVKPRYQRDLRRHLIGAPIEQWTDMDVARADQELSAGFRFLRRPRRQMLDMDRLLNRLEFAAKVHGVRVVCIDPVNEVDHQVGRNESKTDYMGRFIMQLKALADDYNLLMIVCAHPPKDGVEKRLQKRGLLTLNDGADTAHWGNKADIGLCLWRNLDGPTLLHIDKLKDHETMGKPTLAEMHLDPLLNKFTVTRTGYEILGDDYDDAPSSSNGSGPVYSAHNRH